MSEVFVPGAATFFAIWLLLTIMNEFRLSWFNRITRRDTFHLIPRWTFFAPNPPRSDYHLQYRDRLADGVITPWAQIPTLSPRHLYSFLWNPEKRANKVVRDAVTTLRRCTPEDRRNASLMMWTLPYVLLLNYACSMKASSEALHRQFRVVESDGFESSQQRIIFTSEMHSLRPDTP
jgi:hypothetical protein